MSYAPLSTGLYPPATYHRPGSRAPARRRQPVGRALARRFRHGHPTSAVDTQRNRGRNRTSAVDTHRNRGRNRGHRKREHPFSAYGNRGHPSSSPLNAVGVNPDSQGRRSRADPKQKMGVQNLSGQRWVSKTCRIEMGVQYCFLNTMRPAINRPTREHAGKVRRRRTIGGSLQTGCISDGRVLNTTDLRPSHPTIDVVGKVRRRRTIGSCPRRASARNAEGGPKHEA